MSLALMGRARLDNLTKPRGSLGRLEDLALRLFLIQGREPGVDPARIYTVAGDHGVAARGVSLFPQEVTRQMVANFLSGGAAVNVLAEVAGVEHFVVDAGCAGPQFDPHPALIRNRIAPGTADISVGPAMIEEECLEALLLGADLAEKAAKAGIRALGAGDMGIANTTPSTALYCALLDLDPAEVAGPGTGLDRAGVGRKAGIVAQALEANAAAVAGRDPLAVLAALGGLEIACLAGLVLGGAACGLVVCLDGFISTAAYAAARAICPRVSGYCVLSHASAEPGHALAVERLGLEPVLDLGMRLGEGTGAALVLPVLRAAAAVFNRMASFADAGVSESA